MIVKNLIKVGSSDYKEFFGYLASKIPFKDKQFVESKAALRLMSTGLAFWFMILLLKESFFPLPLFVVGAILIVWGISVFLEDNGLYRFSDSYLSNKWLLSAVGAALIYWASFTSARQINSVFEIDPGLLPFTLTSMVLLNLIIFFSLLMIPICLILSFVVLFKFIKQIVGKDQVFSMTFMVVLVFSYYSSLTGLILLSPKKQNFIVRSIALQTDFSYNHKCEGEWLKKKPVIFIESDSSYVLAQSKENEMKYEIQKCISLE